MDPVITKLGIKDFPALFSHMTRHAAESGTDGDVIFRPVSRGETLDTEAIGDRQLAAWSRTLAEPLWLRTWAYLHGGVLRGHLDLNGGRLPSELHRATLGMGLERIARGSGNGRALLETAITWAREHGLSWIDLGVFAHNTRARALYTAAGFVEVGRTRDQFRVDGTSVDDIAMTLEL